MEKDPRDIHYRVIWSYRIIYQITKENIAILDVIHTSQSPEHEAGSLAIPLPTLLQKHIM
jgi:hypothetical protein